ncbi:unnamed protein product [Fusarium graminearum]|nr:unnamed protein product [Fusarium graminearum]
MAPAIPTYETVREEVSSEFENVFQNKPVKFATIREVKDILSDHRLVELYNSLKPRKPGLFSRPQDEGTELPATAERFLALIKSKMLYEFLAVLLYAGCKQRSVEAFVEKMVVGGQAKEQNKRDEKPYHLPQEIKNLDDLLGNFRDAKLFDNVQDLFCVMVIGSPDVVTIKAADKRTLPWHVDTTTKDPLGSNASSKVVKVIVSPYHLTEDGNFSNTKPYEVPFARKSFIGALEAKKNFDEELQTLRKILSSYSQNKNILTSVAAIIEETNPPNFYLLMPLAETDLEHYLEEEREMGMALKTSLLKSATGLADGLRFLHSGIRDGDEKYTCYHLDLKPANVLVFKDPLRSSTNHASDNYKRIWKISDFGISRVKTMNTIDQKQNDRFVDNLFQSQKQKTEQEGASDTQNRRGLGQFLPPEASSRKSEMNEKSDIWSLGCIISVLFTYMAYGSQGVKEYSQARGGRNKFGVERFWESAPFFKKSINRKVSMKHRELIGDALNRNDREAAALEPMLDFLDSRVLKIEKEKRCDAEEIYEQLKKTRKAYSAAQISSAGNQYQPKPFARNSTGRYGTANYDVYPKTNFY